jgi:hypothetical protein
MVQLIAFIIFIVSLGGLVFILYKKIPILVELPQNGHHGFKKPEFILKIEEKVKEKHFHFFEKQMLLHKLLSFAKVWILKIETKIDHLLHGVRKKAQEVEKQNGKRQ